MSIQETVNYFLSNTLTISGNGASEFFCGMTNNPESRRKEHGATKILAYTECSDKDCARSLMKALADEHFDVDPDINSGQDDSKYVYVYKKSSSTIQLLQRTVNLNFQQRWYDEYHLNELPQTNGIYCCFVCDKQLVNNTYNNCRPIYIGMAANGFKSRIQGHVSADHDNWKRHQKVSKNQQLVYAIAEFNEEILQTVESALIYGNQLPENKEYIDGYQGEYHSITVNCDGYKAGLKDSITVTFKE